ncbi:MAG: lamin tail domain-containing protein, partial [Porticoccaceae bacterium]
MKICKLILCFIICMSLVACGRSKDDTINDKCDVNNCPVEKHESCDQVLLEECPEEQKPGNGSIGNIKSEIIINPKTIIINEVSSNNSSFDDEDGDSPDWIELYNKSDTKVDLTGWSITDDSLIPEKWIFPATSIAANSYLKIWASDKDRAEPALHTNFKISSSGEEIT